MELLEKLEILANSAKYDAACTSSGSDKPAVAGRTGYTGGWGICHSFTSDGRCVSMLKVLLTNHCIYNCKYCINRASNDGIKRAAFTPRELADLTMNFYKRNYIDGLFLSSGIVKNPDHTCELMLQVLELLRNEYRFNGYIHAKTIPGADPALITKMGMLADRMSVNVELPSQKSLELLAPDKSKHSIFKPMGFLTGKIQQNQHELVEYRHTPKFVPAGQTTQMIIGATPDTDRQIISLSSALYKKYNIKRVYYSAYIPVSNDPALPSPEVEPPLLREHRLYQADWLIRKYGFEADEIFDSRHENLNPLVDPKCSWALAHMERFPMEINSASPEELLRVPGIGTESVKKIIRARKYSSLDYNHLKRIGVVLKRAQYFITCSGRVMEGLKVSPHSVIRDLISQSGHNLLVQEQYRQISFFAPAQNLLEGVENCVMQMK